MSEKLCLQWNDYLHNIKSSFGNFRGDNDFADVTLACDDGQQVEAHKVILASSSPFIQKLLARNKHQHPVVYMRRVKYDDLLAIMDFLYRASAKCKVCGKEGLGKTIKDHIEANHLDGVAIPCNLCDKTFRSRNALRHHSKQNHS